MPRQVIAIHERLGYWAGHLRPRLAGRPIRWRETRSADDLTDALRAHPCPIAVVDLGDRPERVLEDLVRAAVAAPDALILALDPTTRPGLGELARECGATLARSGFATPPEVAALLERWLPLARRRAEEAGPAAFPEATGDPDDLLARIGLG